MAAAVGRPGPVLPIFAAGLIGAALIAAACGPTPTASPTGSSTATQSAQPSLGSPAPSAPPAQKGGTIYLLTQAVQFDQVDPQRVYGPEDLAFFSGTIYRSLESYVYSADPKQGTSLQPDLATDLGTPSDGGRTWKFTLRDGVTFQDGPPITCEDIRYGVSRTFATDVINQGPTYAIQWLNIPANTDGSSRYPGPYKATPAQQALLDNAIECSADHKTITFHLNQARADFNYTTTLGMFPVPLKKGVDTGATYGVKAPLMSSGPYEVQSYVPGMGGKMILVRNPSWNQASDPIRPAYPDRWEVDFGIDPKVLDQRLVASSGDDATALQYGQLQPENDRAVFGDSQTPGPEFAGRAVSGFDPYARYLWIDVTKVPNLKIRQAMMVALDREAILANFGGERAGSYADGVLKPTIGIDYAPTGIWDTFFGEAIPPSGDPSLARQLVGQSGVAAPMLTFSYPDTPTKQKTFAIVQSSLGKAGFTVKAGPNPGGYGAVFSPQTDFGTGGWAADWPDASTVIPYLFTQGQGSWNLSRVNDPAFSAAVEDAVTTLDRGAQALKWQALDRQAVENAWVIPTYWGLQQTIAGTNVGPIYRWPAYSSWPYGVMYVTR